MNRTLNAITPPVAYPSYPIPKIVLLPILPSFLGIVERSKVAMIFLILFFVESFGASAGLGFYILVEGWGRLAYKEMYAGVVAMALPGVVLYLILDILERKGRRWVSVGK